MAAKPTIIAAAAVVLVLGVGGCQRQGPANTGATVDSATGGDTGQATPVTPVPPLSSTTLPGGAQVQATPTDIALKRYLASNEPAGRAFALPEVRFVGGMQVREVPTGSLATLAALLNTKPSAKVRVEVVEPNPEQNGVNQDAVRRAELVRQELVTNGVSPDRVTSSGGVDKAPNAPVVRLVVTAK